MLGRQNSEQEQGQYSSGSLHEVSGGQKFCMAGMANSLRNNTRIRRKSALRLVVNSIKKHLLIGRATSRPVDPERIPMALVHCTNRRQHNHVTWDHKTADSSSNGSRRLSR